ncbi:MAG: benzylsuccinate synthase gamma subunit family protein [Desulfobacterales bacterium]|nr:benzylsuccinate synthase gamma subunit family protein [Desulfobacterales bacterium]
MTTCKECKSFFPLENDQTKGDCVQRVKDPRQAYYQSRPAKADDDAGACGSFQKKQKT